VVARIFLLMPAMVRTIRHGLHCRADLAGMRGSGEKRNGLEQKNAGRQPDDKPPPDLELSAVRATRSQNHLQSA
jgi:hypothetical protein